MIEIPKNHPRYKSLMEREKIIEGMEKAIVAKAGLIAHGRGEAFDYILGEKTPDYALIQEKAAVAMLMTAQNPVISVNGNVAVICPEKLVELSKKTGADLEVNLFYRTPEREKNIEKILLEAGAEKVLGVNLGENAETIPEITHKRRIVDPEGIYKADVVFVPLEDGDRTMGLRKMGKQVITIDLNPMSRTSVWSNISIVNHVRRALEEMVGMADVLQKLSRDAIQKIIEDFDNNKMLQISVKFMADGLSRLSKEKLTQEVENE